MHTVQFNAKTGKSIVGYEFHHSNGHDEFVTVVVCSDFRVAMEFASYLNGGMHPDRSCWARATFPDESAIKESES